MYESMVLIDESVDLKMDKFHEAFTLRFSKVQSGAPSLVARKGKLESIWKHFSLKLWKNNKKQVLEESEDVAHEFAKANLNQAAIAACSKRIDISGSDVFAPF